MPLTADQFIRVVRCRWAMQRVMDASLIALAIGSVVGLVAVAWPGVPVQSLLGIFAVALLLGIVVGIWRRPRMSDTMREIDAQLNSHELLATAAQSLASDPVFGAVLRSQADAFCQRHDPRQVVVQHHSAAIRVAVLLLAGIALNVTWLRQTTMQTPSTQSSARVVLAAGLPANVPSVASPVAQAETQDHRAELREVDAPAHSFEQAAATARQPGRRGDASGSAAAVTNDAQVPRLPRVVGGESTESRGAGQPNHALAKDGGTTANELSGDAIGQNESRGGASAAPPAAYRELIRAYFSKSSH